MGYIYAAIYELLMIISLQFVFYNINNILFNVDGI